MQSQALVDFMQHRAPGWFHPTEWGILACLNRAFYAAMLAWEDRLPCSCSVFHYHVTEAFLCFINAWAPRDSLRVEEAYGPPTYIVPPRAYHIFPQYSTYVQPYRDRIANLVTSFSRQCCSWRHTTLLNLGFVDYNRTRMFANDRGLDTSANLSEIDRQVIRAGECLDEDVPHRAIPPPNILNRSVTWVDPGSSPPPSLANIYSLGGVPRMS